MNKVIAVSRQYGSGGRQIGKLVAEQLKSMFFWTFSMSYSTSKAIIKDFPLPACVIHLFLCLIPAPADR